MLKTNFIAIDSFVVAGMAATKEVIIDVPAEFYNCQAQVTWSGIVGASGTAKLQSKIQNDQSFADIGSQSVSTAVGSGNTVLPVFTTLATKLNVVITKGSMTAGNITVVLAMRSND
jgi:hypothetical protein